MSGPLPKGKTTLAERPDRRQRQGPGRIWTPPLRCRGRCPHRPGGLPIPHMLCKPTTRGINICTTSSLSARAWPGVPARGSFRGTDADILVLEKAEDVCCGTSKANSAIVHAGYDAAHGSLMAKLNVEGSRRMPALAKELDFAYAQCGSLVVCLSEEDRPALQKLYENGIANGVEGLRIIERDELAGNGAEHLRSGAVAALWAPTGGIVCPFGLTLRAGGERRQKRRAVSVRHRRSRACTPLDGGGTRVGHRDRPRHAGDALHRQCGGRLRRRAAQYGGRRRTP